VVIAALVLAWIFLVVVAPSIAWPSAVVPAFVLAERWLSDELRQRLRTFAAKAVPGWSRAPRTEVAAPAQRTTSDEEEPSVSSS
jgi:hypothetical protein